MWPHSGAKAKERTGRGEGKAETSGRSEQICTSSDIPCLHYVKRIRVDQECSELSLELDYHSLRGS
jgi:hypothetical protein